MKKLQLQGNICGIHGAAGPPPPDPGPGPGCDRRPRKFIGATEHDNSKEEQSSKDGQKTDSTAGMHPLISRILPVEVKRGA